MGKIFLMFWDCAYCGTKGITGDKRECPHCGRPRGLDAKFYRKSDEMIYLSDEEAVNVSRKPDWLCSYCDSLNSDNDQICVGCGATREESDLNYFEMRKKQEEKEREIRAERETREYDSYEEDSYENYSYEKKPETKEDTSFFSRIKTFIKDNSRFFLTGLFALLIVSSLIYLFVPKEKVLNVEEHSWYRDIVVEELKTFDENDWVAPDGARVYDERIELYGYRQVIDHYETQTVPEQRYEQVGTTTETRYVDLGNGYGEEITETVPVYDYVTYYVEKEVPIYRDEPIYQTKYYYEIDRWTHTRDVETSGTGIDPYYGDLVLASKERESYRYEDCYLTCTDQKGKEKTYTISHELWEKVKDGEEIHAYVSFSEIERVKELE